MQNFVSANRISEWIDEEGDCGERMGDGGDYIVVRIWMILKEFPGLCPIQT